LQIFVNEKRYLAEENIMKKLVYLILVILLFSGFKRDLHAFDWISYIQLFGGVPIEKSDKERKHDFLYGFSWENCFAGHFGFSVDADILSPFNQSYGSLFATFHILRFDHERFSRFDPFVGVGFGFTSLEVLESTDGFTTEYTPILEYSAAVEFGLNFWINKYVGLFGKGKIFFNDRFDKLIDFGATIRLYGFRVDPPRRSR
jgi:hypothetical protein